MNGLVRRALPLLVVALIVVTALKTVKFDAGFPAFLRTFGVFAASWVTLCILTFLYKDNPFYKAAEHVMVGLAMGYFTAYYVLQVLKPRFWDKFVLGELEEGDVLLGSPLVFRYALIIPAILGILMLARIFPKVAWISRWPIAATIGIASGLSIPVTIQASITTQLRMAAQLPIDFMQALHGGVERLPGFTNVVLWQVGVPVLILGTICALTYFFFSVPHRGIVGKAASVGVWVLMVGFGASFGYTVMARLSLFIGRVLFLLRDWLDVLPG